MLGISVCIPLRDEAAELPGLFSSLDALRCDDGADVSICLLLDGCQDESLALASEYTFRAKYPVVIGKVARVPSNAGRARHKAMLLGLDAMSDREGILLSTDADSRPSPDWLVAMSSALQHAELVVGRIVRSGAKPSPLQDRVEAYYDKLLLIRRSLDPVPWEAPTTHHHTGGANMGVKAEAYRTLGGFAPVVAGEDARLVDDAARAGLRVRRDAASLVHTSGRREGRAMGGLAASLNQLDGAEASSIRVAHPYDVTWQYRMHAAARTAHDQSRLELVADAIGLSYDHVSGVARDAANAEAFAMCVVPEPPGGMRSVALPVAERELAQLTGAREAA